MPTCFMVPPEQPTWHFFFKLENHTGSFFVWFESFYYPQIFGKMNNLPNGLTLGRLKYVNVRSGLELIISHRIDGTKRASTKDKCLLLSYIHFLSPNTAPLARSRTKIVS